MVKDSSPIIITVIGPVGVGKSTQIQLLRNFFSANKLKNVTTYIKSVHGLTFFLSYIIRKLTKDKMDLRKKIHQRINKVWIISESISITMKFLLLVYLPYQLGYSIIIEEGLKMTIANYQHFRPYFLGVNPETVPFINTLQGWIESKNHLEIILDADKEEVASRRKNRTFRRYETSEYETMQRYTMSNLKGPNTVFIDTNNKSINQVHNIIVEHVKEIMNEG